MHTRSLNFLINKYFLKEKLILVEVVILWPASQGFVIVFYNSHIAGMNLHVRIEKDAVRIMIL